MSDGMEDFIELIKINNYLEEEKKLFLKGLKPIRAKKLREYIEQDLDVTKVDTSEITNFSFMFHYLKNFNQDISKWNVSNGTDFSNMFFCAENFNQDISKWDVSRGTDFSGMFSHVRSFNQDISNWDVSNGDSFFGMFYHAESFKQDISKWDVSNGTCFRYICDSLSVKINKKMINDTLSYIYCDNIEHEKSDIQIIDNDLFELMIKDSGFDLQIIGLDFEIVILFNHYYYLRNENKYTYIDEEKLEKLKELNLIGECHEQ